MQESIFRRIVFRHSFLTLAVLLGCLGLSGNALARNCTTSERTAANADLEGLAANPEAQTALLTKHMPFGVHTPIDEGGNEHLLYQGGYVLLHDGDLRTTLWVAYRLTADDLAAAQGNERIECFRKDPRLSAAQAATPTDYREPIFDQGHMANDADLKGTLINQLNSYIMSNMAPQYCRFNRGIWLSLEHLTRVWAVTYGEIYVTSGSIFDRDGNTGRDADEHAIRMISNNGKKRVAVPSHFYKVFLRKDEDTWRSISFMLPHNNDANGIQWGVVRPKVEAVIVPFSTIESHATVSLSPELSREELVESLDGAEWDFAAAGSNFEGGC